jgi:threonine/homoserine/homoserine lactone efflux protein
MFGIENFETFFIAAIIVVITPGIDTIMVLTRSISQGKMAGIYSALGVSLGLLVHTCAATFGLSIILAKSALAFSIVKYVGAAYLIYMGYKSLTSKAEQTEIKYENLKTSGNLKMFYTALISDVLNPKIGIFFLAFLPQFINNTAINNPIPYLLLGLVMFFITLIWCSILAIMGSKVSVFFNTKKASTWLNKASGVVFILLGLKVAFSKR